MKENNAMNTNNTGSMDIQVTVTPMQNLYAMTALLKECRLIDILLGLHPYPRMKVQNQYK